MISIYDMREKIWEYCSGRQCKHCKLNILCKLSNQFSSDISVAEAYEQLMLNEQNSDIKITPDELQAFLNGGK